MPADDGWDLIRRLNGLNPIDVELPSYMFRHSRGAIIRQRLPIGPKYKTQIYSSFN